LVEVDARVLQHFICNEEIDKKIGSWVTNVRKIGPQSNKIKQMRKQNEKIHNTIETQIYVVHPVWAMSTREIVRSILYYYPANEGIQTTTKPVVTSSSFSHSLLSHNTILAIMHSRNTFPS
jgi:hypothetical protein